MKNTIRNTTDMIRRRLAAGVSWFALHLFAPSTAGTSNWVPREIRVHVESAVIASEAKWVSVAGSFNGWDPNKNPIEGRLAGLAKRGHSGQSYNCDIFRLTSFYDFYVARIAV